MLKREVGSPTRFSRNLKAKRERTNWKMRAWLELQSNAPTVSRFSLKVNY